MTGSIYIILLWAIAYSQAINIVEVRLWVGRPWSLKPPFPRAHGKVRENGYHIVLALAYLAPFVVLCWNDFLCVIAMSITVWLLNDVTWHFWSVSPKYWDEWIRYYFNPRSGHVLWYARFLIANVEVTPRRMFGVTLARVLVLALCVFFKTWVMG